MAQQAILELRRTRELMAYEARQRVLAEIRERIKNTLCSKAVGATRSADSGTRAMISCTPIKHPIRSNSLSFRTPQHWQVAIAL